MIKRKSEVIYINKINQSVTSNILTLGLDQNLQKKADDNGLILR